MSAQDENNERLAKQGKSVVKKDFYINSSDILFKGVFLGYDWNTISGWMQQAGMHGEDGDGYFVICRNGKEMGHSEEMVKIVEAILNEVSPTFSELKVIDD